MAALRFWMVAIGMLVNVCATALADQSVDGRLYFLRYCASCHGAEADGKGFVARAMTRRPPDLRTLARGARDPLIGDRIARYIDGRDVVPAHGEREMPVWGERFGDLSAKGAAQEAEIRERINAIVTYLLSIQVQAKPKR